FTGIAVQSNPIYKNRNPELLSPIIFNNHSINLTLENQKRQVKLQAGPLLERFVRHFDDSWNGQRHDLSFADLCVFAGTPEWLGRAVQPLVSQLMQSQIPIAYLGVGFFESLNTYSFETLTPEDQLCLRKARVVTVRDQRCAELLSPVTPKLLPCPALFSTRTEKQRTGKKKIALSFQGARNGNSQPIPAHLSEYCRKLFHLLAAEYECAYVFHYVDELHEYRDLQNLPIYYSGDPRDYESIYDQFDLCVTTRVHGAGICASLGIPSVVINHSARSETAEGFLAELVNPGVQAPEDVAQIVRDLEVRERSERILEHKKTTTGQYETILKQLFA
ncbi:MAG: polysaccharide pyruvyl transferase family protein, partial [Gemmataceae bacterium]